MEGGHLGGALPLAAALCHAGRGGAGRACGVGGIKLGRREEREGLRWGEKEDRRMCSAAKPETHPVRWSMAAGTPTGTRPNRSRCTGARKAPIRTGPRASSVSVWATRRPAGAPPPRLSAHLLEEQRVLAGRPGEVAHHLDQQGLQRVVLWGSSVWGSSI